MKITMIGAGYVGLVSGACLSDFGHEVTCVDRDGEKVSTLQEGRAPIYEPHLDDLIARNIAAARLSFSTNLARAVSGTRAIFIAVGTPARRGDGGADLVHVEEAARAIARTLDGYAAIIIKSTVPVGTNRHVARVIRETRRDADFDMVSNPEFLREGAAIEDFMRPDRVVVGVEGARGRALMRAIYRPLRARGFPVLITDPESAELIKYASNAFLASKISFINEIAALCEKLGADVKAVACGMGHDGRIGNRFLHAGPGFGGSCFPKDTLALTQMGRRHGAPQRLAETVLETNESVKRRMVEKIIALCGGSVEGKQIGILGVTFKPDTDDMREAPSLVVVPALQRCGAIVRVADPHGRSEGMSLLPDVAWCENAYAAAEGADAIVILTEWNAFRALDLGRLARAMKTPLMADLRNVYDRDDALAAGFRRYAGVGR